MVNLKHFTRFALTFLICLFAISCSEDTPPHYGFSDASSITISISENDGAGRYSEKKLNMPAEEFSCALQLNVVAHAVNGENFFLDHYSIQAETSADWIHVSFTKENDIFSSENPMCTIRVDENKERPRSGKVTISCNDGISSYSLTGVEFTVYQEACEQEFTVYPVDMHFRTNQQYVSAGSGNTFTGKTVYSI